MKFLHSDITGAFRMNPNVVFSISFLFLFPLIMLTDFVTGKNLFTKLYTYIEAQLSKKPVWIPFAIAELLIWIHNIIIGN